MMKYLFACDLDNTLIHSYKHRTSDDICIEHYNGKEQSFISSRAAELLRKVAKELLFIPITTRSIEQYNRIEWLEDTKPKFAVASNGANLIYDDAVDENWQQNNHKYIQPYEDELKQKQDTLLKYFSICRIVDGSFLFLKCDDEMNVEECACDLKTKTNLIVQHFGRKIYLFPPKLNKGEALKMLIQKFSPQQVFCAGDSTIDLPMLNIADVAYVPIDLREALLHKHCVIFDSAEYILKDILTKLSVE